MQYDTGHNEYRDSIKNSNVCIHARMFTIRG